MKGPNVEAKKVGRLTFNDLAAHPIWTWADDDQDESLVIPVKYTGTLPAEGEVGALIVACTFSFRYGTRSAGVLSVRVSDHWVYLLSFPDVDGKLFSFPLQPQLKGMVTLKQLADFLRKPPESIFPITYDTPYIFSDGRQLRGTVNA